MIDSTDLLSGPEGVTPLSPDDLIGLIPTAVVTRQELNEVERENVEDAMIWAFGRKWTPESLLSDKVMRQLHERMFGDVWKWAGKYRKRETSIGVPPADIAVRLRNLLEDVRTQVDLAEDTRSVGDEIAIRFHHRLVQIHPFPNGNGRHARLAADILVVAMSGKRFTWGTVDLAGAGEARSSYLSALRTADADFDYGPLLAFARS